ncbi:MAG: 2-dehydropantoate 2-reductase [Nitrospinota bacterium]|nr:2-dehydropantoate 2-reductase [Nitrospinota bacterium]
MRIIIAGTGGVGGYYGAMLAQAGHEVFFIARGAHLEAIKRDGLAVKSYLGDFSARAQCGPDSTDFGLADLVLVCFKTYHTRSTTGLYATCVGQKTMVLSLQNGVNADAILAERFGEEKVMGGVAFIGSRVKAPGVVLHTGFGSMALGEIWGGLSDRARELGDMFAQAKIKCRVSGDIKKDKYSKMVWNVGFNGVCAIVDCSAGEALKSASTRTLIRTAMLEWIAVARGAGVDLDYELADKNIEATEKGGEVIPSMVMDKRNGRLLETEAINGKVVELGIMQKIPTPLNQFIVDILDFHNKKIKSSGGGV